MSIIFHYRYATEVDVDFVRKSVRAIGRCAIKVDVAAEKCVSTLLDLIQTKVNYVVQEAIVVIKVRTWLSVGKICHMFTGVLQKVEKYMYVEGDFPCMIFLT